MSKLWHYMSHKWFLSHLLNVPKGLRELGTLYIKKCVIHIILVLQVALGWEGILCRYRDTGNTVSPLGKLGMGIRV